MSQTLFSFTPFRLFTMESIQYDEFFRRNGDTAATEALLAYFIDKKNTEIKIQYSNFDSAYSYICGTLDRYSSQFNYKENDFDGFIEFRIGPSGQPEEIEIKGQIDSSSRKFLLFLLDKFRNIKMPYTGNIEYEAYHKIYFYTIDINNYFPNYAKNIKMKDLFSQVCKNKK